MLYSLTLVLNVISPGGVALLAAASDNPTGVPTTITLGGVLAVYLGMEVADKRGSHSERDRLRLENAELRAELRAQNNVIATEVIPTITRNSDLLPEVAKVLAQVAERLRRRAP